LGYFAVWGVILEIDRLDKQGAQHDLKSVVNMIDRMYGHRVSSRGRGGGGNIFDNRVQSGFSRGGRLWEVLGEVFRSIRAVKFRGRRYRGFSEGCNSRIRLGSVVSVYS
jgi:hypothetical protein